MTKARTLALLVVVAHWMVAIIHLFFAAEVLPPPNNHVAGMAIILITAGHLLVSLVLWKVGDTLSGLISLIFFLAAMSADLYGHFLHASGNNVFMVASGSWTVWFDVSVAMLLALEILGCLIGTWMLGGWSKKKSAPATDTNSGKRNLRLSASLSL